MSVQADALLVGVAVLVVGFACGVGFAMCVMRYAVRRYLRSEIADSDIRRAMKRHPSGNANPNIGGPRDSMEDGS